LVCSCTSDGRPKRDNCCFLMIRLQNSNRIKLGLFTLKTTLSRTRACSSRSKRPTASLRHHRIGHQPFNRSVSVGSNRSVPLVPNVQSLRYVQVVRDAKRINAFNNANVQHLLCNIAHPTKNLPRASALFCRATSGTSLTNAENAVPIDSIAALRSNV
jgi:hypothetical protein